MIVLHGAVRVTYLKDPEKSHARSHESHMKDSEKSHAESAAQSHKSYNKDLEKSRDDCVYVHICDLLCENRPFRHIWYFEKYHFETLKPLQFSCAVF